MKNISIDKNNFYPSLQRAFSTAQSGDTIVLPRGIYTIRQGLLVSDKNDLTILGNGCTIKMADKVGLENKNALLKIKNCTNLSIFDLTLDGNRENRPKAEVFCHALILLNIKGAKLKDISVKNSVVDGVYISTYNPENENQISRDIELTNVNVTNSYRNAMSIIYGYNILVSGGSYSDSNGIAPEAGIDVEANKTFDHPSSKNIVIEGVELSNNNGWGILVSSKGRPHHIQLYNNIVDDCGGGIKHTTIESVIKGNHISYCNRGMDVFRYHGRPIDNNQIINNNISNCGTGLKYIGFGGLIEGNTITDCKEYGIELRGNSEMETKVSAIENTVKNIEGKGIYSRHCSYATISDNKIITTSEEGMILMNGEQIVKNNILKENLISIYSVGSNSIIEGNTISDYGKVAIRMKDSGRGLARGKISKNKIAEIESKSKLDVRSKNVIIDK
ncbi:MAG: right-handed parallel beta-helix repeat-containing protein [Saprospiraceae bacterium]|nr:right-handed parallel beta-helix repeat-containing protein [Saprospiraceae bacterium]